MLGNWSSLSLQDNVGLDMGSTHYPAIGLPYRKYIITQFQWIIHDGGGKDVVNPVILEPPRKYWNPISV